MITTDSQPAICNWLLGPSLAKQQFIPWHAVISYSARSGGGGTAGTFSGTVCTVGERAGVAGAAGGGQTAGTFCGTAGNLASGRAQRVQRGSAAGTFGINYIWRAQRAQFLGIYSGVLVIN